ncbi:GatB YqeY domain-containing protein [Agrilactobacillus composti DSM 18527 = JCM 14202]|uniref:GatB YqeY domain-containing protein n=1 Tax=Agrilactobacillus composti DSM 18527 = JCM 14202 TaxID=1423734 RepID=X0PSB5_9LACO|nr:GatB/YqeY domain-containing protein [Agrilactobacillus composti]KRM33458.1 GatB YqeY domain-containing protein [Agrilactobacillus composti DSM 18527 = JCM 14202]GAF40797.1 transamidase GatB domain protein [Agrilactobacillus composti DSM 18527 = JCM 14202]
MSLLATLNEDMKTAMKARDKDRLAVIRMLKTAVTNDQIKLGHDLTSEEELVVLSRELKQRKESLADFQKANRQDLIDHVNHEIEIVAAYMPKQLADQEVKDLVLATIDKVGAKSTKDFGKVMGALMPQVKGKADGGKVNAFVKEALTNL